MHALFYFILFFSTTIALAREWGDLAHAEELNRIVPPHLQTRPQILGVIQKEIVEVRRGSPHWKAAVVSCRLARQGLKKAPRIRPRSVAPSIMSIGIFSGVTGSD